MSSLLTEHFAQIPLALLKDTRPEATVYVRLLYAAIHSYCTFGKTTGAYPRTEQLAERIAAGRGKHHRRRHQERQEEPSSFHSPAYRPERAS